MEATKNIMGVLLGLNRFYHPVNSAPFKGMDKLIQKMAIAPTNLSFRLKQILREEPQIAVNHLGELPYGDIRLSGKAYARGRYNRTQAAL